MGWLSKFKIFFICKKYHFIGHQILLAHHNKKKLLEYQTFPKWMNSLWGDSQNSKFSLYARNTILLAIRFYWPIIIKKIYWSIKHSQNGTMKVLACAHLYNLWQYNLWAKSLSPGGCCDNSSSCQAYGIKCSDVCCMLCWFPKFLGLPPFSTTLIPDWMKHW